MMILVDIMDTLVVDPFFTAVPAYFDLTLEQLLEVKHPTSWKEFECGTIGEAEYAARYFRDGRSVDIQGLKACVGQHYRWVDGMQQVVVELQRAGHQLHALSNYSAWYQLIEDRLRLSQFLQWSFVSCHTGVRKPDPAAYREPARTLGVDVEQCVFIDDREANTTAAAALGMPALLMTTADELRSKLRQRGLLPI